MTKKNTNPEVRFAGFTDDWKNWKIGEILTEKKNSIEILDNEIYELVKVRRRNEGVVSRGFLKGKDILVKNYFEVKEGDYIISKRQVVHGANGIIPKSLNKAVVSNEYLVLVGNEKIGTAFWTIISKLPDMYRKFFLSSYGVDIEKLVFDVEDWKKRTVIIPELTEQKKIIELFNVLENLIIRNQKKYDKLLTLKKAMLDKMFPKNCANIPEIRFKGFTDTWIERKFLEIFNYERPDNYIVKSVEYSVGYKTPVLTANKAFILGYTDETNTFNKASIIFDDFTLDFKYVNFPYMVKSSAIKILTIKDENIDDLDFTFNLLATTKIENMGHARHYISVVQHSSILVPKIEEQKKIANYFANLSRLININKIELEKLKNIKKACFKKILA